MLKLYHRYWHDLIHQNNIVFLYSIIFSIGLIKFSFILSHCIHQIFFPNINYILNSTFNWITNSPPDKSKNLLSYLIGIALFFTLYSLSILLKKYLNKKNQLIQNNKILKTYLISSILINIIFLFSSHNMKYLFAIWLTFFCYFPLSCFQDDFLTVFSSYTLILITLMTTVLHFILIFLPFLIHPMFIQNDFYNIPEKTRLKNGETVDNIKYINKHQIGGLLRYDPRIDQGETPAPRAKTFIKLPFNPLINAFITLKNREHLFFYNKKLETLSIRDQMIEEDLNDLRKIYLLPEEQRSLLQLYYDSLAQNKFYKNRLYSSSEEDFIARNKIEMNYQNLVGWFFHHHAHMIFPINALHQHAKLSEQHFLYGALYTITLSKLMKEVNYQDYFKVIFSGYLVYYFMFLAIIFFIFRRIEYVLASALLLNISTFFIGMDCIKTAPGFNPLRHLFDMIVFYFFYLYTTQLKKRYLTLSIIFSLFSILWNKDFGIFLFLSIVGATIVQQGFNKRYTLNQIILYLLLIITGLCLYFLPMQGTEDGTLWMLLGVNTPKTSVQFIVCLLGMISFGYFFLVQLLFNHDTPLKFLFTALFFYCQLISIYFIWCPAINHIASIAGPFISLSLLLFFLFFKPQAKKIIACYLFFGLIIVYIISAILFHYDAYQLNKIFKTHVVYNWKLNHAHFQSTMDPDLFEESVTLINQYEHSNKFLLLSQYNTIFPILVNKYNILPYIDTMPNLINIKDVNLVMDRIQTIKPQYAFIDTDMARNFNGEIFNANDPLLGEYYDNSLSRVRMIKTLQQLYNKVIMCYTPIKKGRLITVYERKKLNPL